jgi:hypothetical protein
MKLNKNVLLNPNPNNFVCHYNILTKKYYYNVNSDNFFITHNFLCLSNFIFFYEFQLTYTCEISNV